MSPTPHGDKLQALFENPKLPPQDRKAVEQAIAQYHEWLFQLKAVQGTPAEIVEQMTVLLNDYRLHIDMKLIFDSNSDFLYRQKGQLKLDNTVIEEFLPLLVTAALADDLQDSDLSLGAANCFSGMWFESSLAFNPPAGGMQIRSKDQDFAITRNLFIRASSQSDFQESVTKETAIPYLVAECKTNLDKTMFQEAAATAVDVKSTVPGAKYYLLCEWLDMTPISSATTAVDEIIILRRSKRVPSNIRKAFHTTAGRQQYREFMLSYLQNHPFSVEMFLRFINHIHRLISKALPDEGDVLDRGYF